jgi:hypothetical protein
MNFPIQIKPEKTFNGSATFAVLSSDMLSDDDEPAGMKRRKHDEPTNNSTKIF